MRELGKTGRLHTVSFVQKKVSSSFSGAARKDFVCRTSLILWFWGGWGVCFGGIGFGLGFVFFLFLFVVTGLGFGSVFSAFKVISGAAVVGGRNEADPAGLICFSSGKSFLRSDRPGTVNGTRLTPGKGGAPRPPVPASRGAEPGRSLDFRGKSICV